jgi:hypothetical protein
MSGSSALSRKPPAYQAYASDWIAEEAYAMASLAERGLLFSMLNYCWVNETISADVEVAARLLALDAKEISLAWGELVKRHFQPVPGRPDRLMCAELERQRAKSAEYRHRQASSGRIGGRRTQERIREKLGLSAASSDAQADETKRQEANRKEPSNTDDTAYIDAPDEDQAWISAYEREQSAQK